MGMFQRNAHDQRKFIGATGQSGDSEAGQSARRFTYAQSNGWQPGRTSFGGRSNRLTAFRHRWTGRSE